MDTSPDFLVVMFQAHHSAKVPSTNRILSQNPTTNQPSNMKDDQFNSNKDPTSFEFEHLGFKTLFTKEKSNLYEQIASKFQFDRFKQIPNISGKTKQQAVKPKAKKTSEFHTNWGLCSRVHAHENRFTHQPSFSNMLST